MLIDTSDFAAMRIYRQDGHATAEHRIFMAMQRRINATSSQIKIIDPTAKKLHLRVWIDNEVLGLRQNMCW